MDRGISPWKRCINLDFCICAIPTVGFYEKYGREPPPYHTRLQPLPHLHLAMLLTIKVPALPSLADDHDSRSCRRHHHRRAITTSVAVSSPLS